MQQKWWIFDQKASTTTNPPKRSKAIANKKIKQRTYVLEKLTQRI